MIIEKDKELPPVPVFAEQEASKLSKISDYMEPFPLKENENKVDHEE